jgi:hypothetical protein
MPYNASHQRLRQAWLAEVRLHALVMSVLAICKVSFPPGRV